MIKLSSLNENQRDAVQHVDGPVVVVAGAGTGKTRTIAYRTAFLIDQGIPPENILAITFTNKAAREMRERISKMLGADICARMTVSTIHSLCVRLLREDFGALGRDPKFSIFDTTDQTGLIRKALVDHGFDPHKNDPRDLLWRIGKVKNVFPVVESEDFADPVFRQVYLSYNTMLETNNALDFDDLLIYGSRLLENKKILEKYQERFRYIMVDEYQDINGCQYSLIRKLSAKSKNLYVVGDDDQSVYGWRGAQVENILNFERDFKGAKVVKLERNYRSTGAILEAANAVIANNTVRRAKKLWTTEKEGHPASVIAAADAHEEAARVLDYIIAEKKEHSLRYGDFAILYRTNAQSRLFEERLVHLGISYIMIGGTKFFERREIKDVASYLRVLVNTEDEFSLLRIVNFPPRGIGKTSFERIREAAFEAKKPFFEALREAASGAGVSSKARDGIRAFFGIYDELKKQADAAPDDPASVVRMLLKKVNFKAAYEAACADKNEAVRRFENVEEFINAVVEYQRTEPKPSLEGFLENIALMTEETENEEELKEESVTLMTLHSAKGLEFKLVFLVGAEEGYMPHELSEAEGNIEEERRLFYVGMTRARRRLFISYACERHRYGQIIPREPSRFIEEIPPKYLVWEDNEEYEKAKQQAGEVIVDSSIARIQAILDRG
ncbi:MAG: UvrD-helicase domain-containing protein [bacterium]